MPIYQFYTVFMPSQVYRTQIRAKGPNNYPHIFEMALKTRIDTEVYVCILSWPTIKNIFDSQIFILGPSEWFLLNLEK